MADELLEERLRELGELAEWPPTPDLATGVRLRLAMGDPGPALAAPSWRRRAVPWAVAAAIALALAVGLTPPAREAVAGWLGLTHVTIRRVQVLPSPAVPVSSGRRLVTLDEARAAAGFRIRLPKERVAAIYVTGEAPGGEVELSLADGVIVTELGGSFNENFLAKVIGPGTSLVPARVNGHPGVWINGAPHEVAYLDRAGNFRVEKLRLAGDVLIWEEDGVVLRVEGASSEEQALRIAAGLG